VHDVRGDTALLVIEFADSSLDHDTGAKAATYAKYGVCEYWVIDAKTRQTQVFRNPKPEGYASWSEKSAKAKLTSKKVPELTVVLAKLV
jgi:Uma2 family endonuclease